MGFSVTVIPPMKTNEEIISSTAIRKALAEGDMKRVANMSGSSFSLEARVVSGTGRGIELGFPTANMDIDSKQALPADGVYATRAYIDGKVYQSMTNIGRRPTFSGSNRTIEVHVLGYRSDLSGSELKIDIIERLRSEKKFKTVEELKQQIADDIKQGKAILNS